MQRIEALGFVAVQSTLRAAAVAAIAVTVVASSASSQINCDLGTMPHGTWSGAFDLNEMVPQAEIALAAVLPPPMIESELGRSRVLFACRTSCGEAIPVANVQTRTFVWRPSDPDESTQLDVDVAPADLVGDGFCSGLALDGQGRLRMVGGLNIPDKCAGNSCDPVSDPEQYLPVGHRKTYTLVTSGSTLDWIVGADLNIERWYPTVIPMDDGTLLVLGHEGQPNPQCPAPYTSGTYPLGSSQVDELRELIDPSGPSVGSLVYNQLISSGCTAGANLRMGPYPRVHLGRNGRLFWTNGLKVIAPHETESRIYSMDVNPATACNPPLWSAESTQIFGGHVDGGSSVHLIYLDDQVPPAAHEVLYFIGGTTTDDDEPCADLTGIRADVLKVVDPGAGATWTAAPSLSEPRVNHNTVILPNGQLLVVGGGGAQLCDFGQQEPTRVPEIYSPPEIFSGISPDEWEALDDVPSAESHLYHSVAGLLLDGRVFLAGSSGVGQYAYYHTIEVFSPWYYFSPNRPVIETWPKPTNTGETGLVGYADEFEITVDAPCLINRVVLVGSGAATHAFDASQRYVELAFTKVGGTMTHPTLEVIGPENGYSAPPGFYMLFAIDTNEVPSKGRWVRVGDS